VWTHDTGYILHGMLAVGFVEEAQVLARGLLRAADGFDQRLPELFSGESADSLSRPVPYPASCRPQAWAPPARSRWLRRSAHSESGGPSGGPAASRSAYG